ncbi:MAG: beta-lactamase family protein [Pyrinomonadaceae bacterium]|nr:beta-lactamase family protein [Pyrinomonadaceae bacterium]
MKVNHKKLFVRLFIFLLAGHGFIAQASGQSLSGQSLSEQSSRSSNTRLDTQVDSYIKQQVQKYKIPGLSVVVVKKGRVVKLRGYGVASVEFDVPAVANTVYQLFSVSKIFAGVAVMKLVEDGKLSLDTPVTDIVPNLPREWRAIEIQDLLTHTSGLPELSSNPRFACLPEDKKRRVTADEEIAFLSELPLKFQPGSKWSYHLSGYQLLGFIVQRLTKKSYAAFLDDQVFKPLGMSATKFGGTEAEVIKRRSPTSYSRETGQLAGWVYPFSARDYPAAGLNSSAADLAKFFIALDSDKVLTRENLEEMWAPVELNNGTEKPYGLGWTVDEHKGRKVVGHEGGGAIWVAHFPDEQLSVVVLCNLNGARADEIQYGIADFYLGL